MKSISIFLLLFIIKSSISIESNDVMKEFIKRLKKEGIFEIIQTIKNTYGIDLAIIACEEFSKNASGMCKRLIIDYMPYLDNSERNEVEKKGSITDKNVMKKSGKNRLYILSEIEKPNNYWDKLKEILSTKFNPEETELYADRIITRVEQELGYRQKEQKQEEEEELEKGNELERELEKRNELERELEKEQVQIH